MKRNSASGVIFLFRYFFSAYPIRGAVMVIAMLFAGIASGLGFVSLLPLLNHLTGLESAPDNGMMQFVDQTFSLFGTTPTLGNLLLLLTILFSIKGLLLIWAMSQVGYTTAKVTAKFRIELLQALMDAKWPYFVRHKTGTFATAISSQPDRAAFCFLACCNLLAAGLETAILTIVALSITWEITLAAVVAGALMLKLLGGAIGYTRKAAQRQTELHESLLSRMVDGLNGMKHLKAMGLQKRLLPLMEEDVKGIQKTDRQLVLSKEILVRLPEPLRIAFISVGLYILIALLNQPAADLLVLMAIFYRTTERLSTMQSRYQNAIRSIPSFWFVYMTIRRAQHAKEPVRTGTTPDFKKEIRFHNVDFSYGKTVILKGAELILPHGSFTAVVGPSGAGKTTVADLIIGLLEPRNGQVKIDDTDLRDTDLTQWRQSIGYVPQETILFHVSIFDNITLGDESITRAEVQEALKQAEASFIDSLPDGLDTMVGERGAKLSGGQRQRIAIARALVRKPSLLVLDEATTALDPITEQSLCKTFTKLNGKTTILAISHQPALQQTAERVYQLRDKRLTLE